MASLMFVSVSQHQSTNYPCQAASFFIYLPHSLSLFLNIWLNRGIQSNTYAHWARNPWRVIHPLALVSTELRTSSPQGIVGQVPKSALSRKQKTIWHLETFFNHIMNISFLKTVSICSHHYYFPQLTWSSSGERASSSS